MITNYAQASDVATECRFDCHVIPYSTNPAPFPTAAAAAAAGTAAEVAAAATTTTTAAAQFLFQVFFHALTVVFNLLFTC